MSQDQDRPRLPTVPPDFREEVAAALADGQRGDLALLALETHGFPWGVEGLREVGRAQLALGDRKGARATWEEVRDAYPDDAEASLRLGAINQSLGDPAASDVTAGDDGRGQPHVFLFTGHRIDAPGRAEKRFPPEAEPVAREAIKAAIVAELGEGNTDAVGIAGGASGGDILFHEVCRELGIKTYLYLALPRDEYVSASVEDSGPAWVRRFDALYDALDRRVLSRSKEMPRWLREKDGEYGIWQRSNLWMLTNAVALDRKGGGSNLTLIALWNGRRGDGAGGTEDMTAQARKRGAQTRILQTERLFQPGA